MPIKPRINMIILAVRDLPAVAGFYEHGLGFPRMESPPEVAFFTLDGTWLALYGREALAEDATVRPRARGSGASHWRTTSARTDSWAQRKEMVDRTEPLQVSRQCALLDLPRSTFYKARNDLERAASTMR